MRSQHLRKSKSFTTYNTHPLNHHLRQFRQLTKGIPHSKIAPIKHTSQDKSFSDSESSDQSCLEKKYYRCGCITQAQGTCHHSQYRDYLAEMREQKARRREKRKLNESMMNMQVEKIDSDQVGELQIFTPKKQGPLDRIVEINESAEYSKKKSYNSISIVVGGKKYYKTLGSKEQLLYCFTLLSQMLQQ